jgi:hypothetical protein
VKALLINNLVSPYSVGSNCEEDESCGVLDALKDLLKEDYIIQRNLPEVKTPQFSSLTEEPTVTSANQDLATPYVEGFVAKKIQRKVTCTACKNIMEAATDLPQNLLIRQREFHRLVHPSCNFSKAVKHISSLIFSLIPKYLLSFVIKKIYISGNN